ncbi:hypothetical protein FHX77_000480 [Bifidobacterium commune]|uniref:hypothetical protein n=1 Tax=Bifidobacterium commune TaxID=1505727 RepID=UPI000B861454|nr:hypothetical protein [Bifidobacterium commune]MBB2955100.1 hypothetical protein [Bifidobacterium commune]
MQINRTSEKSKRLATAGIVVSAISFTIGVALTFLSIAGLNEYIDGLEDGGTYCEGTDCESYPPEDSYPNDEDTDAKTNETYYLYDWQQALPASSLISVR